jgi:hypothetical protein
MLVLGSLLNKGKVVLRQKQASLVLVNFEEMRDIFTRGPCPLHDTKFNDLQTRLEKIILASSELGSIVRPLPLKNPKYWFGCTSYKNRS